MFGLHEGQYVPLAEPWLEQVGLGLTLWEGTFEGLATTWLRWCDRKGNLLPTGAEQAAQERLRAEQAEAKAAKLAARLRELGVDHCWRRLSLYKLQNLLIRIFCVNRDG